MFIENNCTIEHEGQQFTAGGAYRDETQALVYIEGDKATDWHGNRLGSVRVVSEWIQVSWGGGESYTMTAVHVKFDDGTNWVGRYGSDWAQACRLRRAA